MAKYYGINGKSFYRIARPSEWTMSQSGQWYLAAIYASMLVFGAVIHFVRG